MSIGTIGLTAGSATSGSTISFTHSVSPAATAGNFCLVVMPTKEGAAGSVTALTCNGTALTRVDIRGQGVTTAGAEMWTLAGAHSGTIAVTFSANMDNIQAPALSLLNVNQSTPTDSSNTAYSAGNTTLNVNVTSAAGKQVIDIIAVNSDGALTVGAGQTQLFQQNVDGSGGHIAGVSIENGAGTTAMSWTWTGTRAAAMVGASFVTDDYVYVSPGGAQILII